MLADIPETFFSKTGMEFPDSLLHLGAFQNKRVKTDAKVFTKFLMTKKRVISSRTTQFEPRLNLGREKT